MLIPGKLYLVKYNRISSCGSMKIYIEADLHYNIEAMLFLEQSKFTLSMYKFLVKDKEIIVDSNCPLKLFTSPL